MGPIPMGVGLFILKEFSMKKGILGALPIVAAAYADRFGVRVNVGGDQAYTDGQAIQIPAIEKSYGNMNVVWGYLAHESAHIKWSDFTAQKCSPFEHELVNTFEDCRIEAAMIQEYPGTATTLGALDQFLIDQGFHGVPNASWNPASIILSTCLFWGMIKLVHKHMFDSLMGQAYLVLCQEMGEAFGLRLIHLLDTHLPQATSTQDVRALAAAIIALMQAEGQLPPQQPAASITQQPSPQQGQQPPGEGQANQSQGNIQGDDSSAGQGQSTSGDQPGAEAQGSAQQGTGAANQSQNGQGILPHPTKAEEMQQTAQCGSNEKDWVHQALNAGAEDLPKDRMQAIRKELDLHEDPQAKYLTVRAAPETAKNEWQGRVLQRAAERVGTRLQHELMGLVQSKARTAQKARTFGKRLDANRILRVMSGDPKVFRTLADRTSPNTAIHLLVDVSGSMNTGNRLATAQTAAMALAKALDAIKGVNPAVSFFGGCTDDPVRSAMRHGQKTMARTAHFAPVGGGGTPMAEGIWYAAYELSKTRERRKMLIVITDGKSSNEPATRSVIDLAEQSGMDVIGIGIETLANERIFSRHIVINKVDDLCQNLFRLMGNYLASDLAA